MKHHYFASTAVSWAVAPTRQGAITKAARIAGADIIKRNVKANGGLYVWSCRVDTPIDQPYEIESYRPSMLTLDGKSTGVGVPIAEAGEHFIQNTKGHVTLDDGKE